MSKILLAVWALFILVFLSSCQDRQAELESQKIDALKTMLNQSNNKQLSDEEIRAKLRRNNSNKTTSN
jgi:hypothetical protein